jgi:hypothetical protein
MKEKDALAEEDNGERGGTSGVWRTLSRQEIDTK